MASDPATVSFGSSSEPIPPPPTGDGLNRSVTFQETPPPGPLRGVVKSFSDGSRQSRVSTHLANEYGLDQRKLKLKYYFSFFKWIPNYSFANSFRGDLMGALTVGSIYVPMALSLAANLGHIPAIHGLYTFAIALAVYGFFGTSPTLIVGPEVPCSLLTGQAVLEYSIPGNERRNAEVAGIITLTGGMIVFIAGIFRLGFLDDIVSRPFLRGFISSIGLVIMIEQLVPMLGMNHSHGPALKFRGMTTVQRMVTTYNHFSEIHTLTAVLSLSSLAILLVLEFSKKRFGRQHMWVRSFPDRFLVVLTATLLSRHFDLHGKGVEIMGNVSLPGKLFPRHYPFEAEDISLAKEMFSTSFIIALLGFFESSVSSKSLALSQKPQRKKSDGPNNNSTATLQEDTVVTSTNRELVALGLANMVGGIFMCLPAFGGYGRSKVGAESGATTPMVSLILAAVTALCALFLTPALYYIPRGVLSAMIAQVGFSLLREPIQDAKFFYRTQGWSELLLMVTIFIATVGWDLKMGISVGIGLSILLVIRHSTRSRIQILWRNPKTGNFENAEDAGVLDDNHASGAEAGCLVVKIPEPLFFANTGGLESRLRRLELYGTGYVHPSLPRLRPVERTKNIIIDVGGMTRIDGAGAQVLGEIVDGYMNRPVPVQVYFSGLRHIPTTRTVSSSVGDEQVGLGPRKKSVWETFLVSGIVKQVGADNFVESIDDALDRIREVSQAGGSSVAAAGRQDMNC